MLLVFGVLIADCFLEPRGAVFATAVPFFFAEPFLGVLGALFLADADRFFAEADLLAGTF